MNKKSLTNIVITFFLLTFLIPSTILAGNGDIVGGILLTLIIPIIVFFLLREVMCWYWKINIRLEKMDKIISLLERNTKNNTYQIEEEIECLKCGSIIDKNSKVCKNCGWSYSP